MHESVGWSLWSYGRPQGTESRVVLTRAAASPRRRLHPSSTAGMPS